MDSIQLVLFDEITADSSKRQTLLQNIAPGQCIVSRFNTRKNPSEEQIARLADRIRCNGYELTRAVWAYRNGDEGFEVFAGGTRLKAAQQAGVNIPIILFEGYNEEEISRLSDLDNENDAYHEPVSPIEVWAEYARLRDEEGWTQERIAKVKKVDQAWVSRRLKFHNLPDRLKQVMRQDWFTEGHLAEIAILCVDACFSPWLTTEQVWQDLVEKAVEDKKKNGKKSVRAVKQDVTKWKKFIDYAGEVHQGLSPIVLYKFPGDDRGEPEPFEFDAPVAFIDELADRQARNLTATKEAERKIRLHIDQNLQDYQTYINEKSAEAARQAIKAKREAEVLSCFIHADCLDVADSLEPKSVRLLLVDPPYGQEYQSNRRWASETPPLIEGDSEEDALGLFEAMLKAYKPTLGDDAHILVFCNWQNEPAFRRIIERQGLNVKGSLVWVKEGHSAGDLKGSFAPSHERIIHAIQGAPVVQPRIRDVLEFNRDLSTDHPTTKPTPLLEKLILSCTNEGDLVIDPMAGIASTLIASLRNDRLFWGCEIEKCWHDIGCERLLQEIDDV